MKSIFIRIHPFMGGRAVASEFLFETVRVMVVYDAQANGALPAAADLLASMNPNGGAPIHDALAPINLNNRERFLILKDKSWNLAAKSGALYDASAQGSEISHVRGMKMFIKLRGLDTTFNSSVDATTGTNTVANIATGALLFVWTCRAYNNMGAIATGITNLYITPRLRFYD